MALRQQQQQQLMLGQQAVLRQRMAMMNPAHASLLGAVNPQQKMLLLQQQLFQQQHQQRQAVMQQMPPGDGVSARLWVGSLNYDLSEADVRAAFSPFGEIMSVDMSYEPLTGKTKGYCFIEYRHRNASVLAEKMMNGATLAGRQIKVGRPNGGPASATPAPNPMVANMAMNPMLAQLKAQLMNKAAALGPGPGAVPPPPPPDALSKSKRVYVGSVAPEITADQIKTIFANFGKILKCEFLPSPEDPQKHRGFGFLEFDEESAAGDAVSSMNDFPLAGRVLKVARVMPVVKSAGTDIQAAVAAAALVAKQKAAGVGAPEAAPNKPESLASQEGVKLVKGQSKLDLMKQLSRGDSSLVPGKTGGGTGSAEEKSPVVLLVNMVGPDELDDGLAEEVQGECSKFGKVVRVHIHNAEDLNQVRIFVEYEGVDQAAEAVDKLNGRWFGGREIQARFYPSTFFNVAEYEK